jgi:hypothetical protein
MIKQVTTHSIGIVHQFTLNIAIGMKCVSVRWDAISKDKVSGIFQSTKES